MPYRWAVLAAGTVAQAAFSTVTFAIAVLAPALRDKYDLSLTEIGIVLAAEWVGLTLALLPWGFAVDRYGERWTLAGGLAVCAALLAGAVMDQLLQDGRTVIWVGIPNDDNPDVTFRMQVQDETVKAAAAERPAIHFVDTWTRFAGRNGGWAEYVVDPRDNIGKDVRADDGFHLNETGAEILALDIAQVVRDDLAARGADV